MTALHHSLIFAAAFLAVFCQSAFGGVRHLLGAQVDLLPALMVYAALNAGLVTVMSFALFAGLLFDSLSANALGTSVLPLLVIGVLIQFRRDLILREQVFAQAMIGLLASALAPLLTVLMLMTNGQSPLLGWGSLWQWIVMSAGGGIATPVLFVLFGWFNRTFGYRPFVETSFRADREIRRGRN
jgi:rod shape-determining protein MreD